MEEPPINHYKQIRSLQKTAYLNWVVYHHNKHVYSTNSCSEILIR